MIERLAAEHQDATIALRFATPLELLISVMLSAQTTDVNVNRVTERLFREFQRPEDYLAVPQEELERRIYATGYFRQKARSIQDGQDCRLLLAHDREQAAARTDELTRRLEDHLAEAGPGGSPAGIGGAQPPSGAAPAPNHSVPGSEGATVIFFTSDWVFVSEWIKQRTADKRPASPAGRFLLRWIEPSRLHARR